MNTVESHTNVSSYGKSGFGEAVNKAKSLDFIRFCATVMCHSVKSGMYGFAKDIEISAERTRILNDKLLGLLAKNCGYTLDEMKKMLEHDLFMDAHEALSFGIVDYII